MYAIRIPKILKTFFTPYHHRSTPSRINALQIFSIFFEELNTSCIAPSAGSSLFCIISHICVSSPCVCFFFPYISLLRRIFSSHVHPFAVCMYTLCVSFAVWSVVRPDWLEALNWSIRFQSVGLLRVD